MKIKVAYGDFSSDAANHSAPGAQVVTSGDLKAIFAITNKCKVHGVFFFNAESDEPKVYLTDLASGDYAAAAAAPIVYSTIVPRDATFSKTMTYGVDPIQWTTTFAYDLYDTHTGLYDTFPKPGFLFEKGVAVVNTGTYSSANSNIHYLIFYSE